MQQKLFSVFVNSQLPCVNVLQSSTSPSTRSMFFVFLLIVTLNVLQSSTSPSTSCHGATRRGGWTRSSTMYAFNAAVWEGTRRRPYVLSKRNKWHFNIQDFCHLFCWILGLNIQCWKWFSKFTKIRSSKLTFNFNILLVQSYTAA